jgi:hypothetical protein
MGSGFDTGADLSDELEKSIENLAKAMKGGAADAVQGVRR